MLKKIQKLTWIITLNIFLLIIGCCFFNPLNAQSPELENSNVSLDFDGIDDWVEASSGMISGNDDFTLEAWVRSSNPDNSTNCIGNFRRVLGWGGNNTRFEIGDCGGIFSFYSNESGILSSAISITDGNWHHIAATKKGNEVIIYLDGAVVITHVLTIAYELSNFFRIGRWPGGGASTETWAGQVDEVRLWNFARSLEAIIETKDNCLSGGEAGLATYYNFNEGQPFGENTQLVTIRDISGNGNDGVLKEFSLTGDISNFVETVPFESVCMEECLKSCAPEGTNNNNLFIESAIIDGVTINNSNNAYTVLLEEVIYLDSDVVSFNASTTNPEGTEIDSVFWRVLYDANNDGVFNPEEEVFNSGKVPVGEVGGELDFSNLNLPMNPQGNIAIEMTSDEALQGICDGAMIPPSENYQLWIARTMATGGRLTVVKKKKNNTNRTADCTVDCLPDNGNIEFAIVNTTGSKFCKINITDISLVDNTGTPLSVNLSPTNIMYPVEIYNANITEHYINSKLGPSFDLDDGELALFRANYTGTLAPLGEEGSICVEFEYEENCGIIKQDTGCIEIVFGCPDMLDSCMMDICSYFSPFPDSIIIGTSERQVIQQTNLKVFPNPFKDHITIDFELVEREQVSIHLVDVLGRTVQTIVGGQALLKGNHTYNVSTSNLPKGLYYLKMQVGPHQFGRGIIHSE